MSRFEWWVALFFGLAFGAASVLVAAMMPVGLWAFVVPSPFAVAGGLLTGLSSVALYRGRKGRS